MHALKVSAVLLILLAIVIAVSLYTNGILSRTAEDMEKRITGIENDARAGNWSKAEAQLYKVKSEWSDTERTWSVLIDHLEIDNIGISLLKMEEYIATKDAPLALAEAAALKHFIKHVPEKEALTLKNVF